MAKENPINRRNHQRHGNLIDLKVTLWPRLDLDGLILAHQRRCVSIIELSNLVVFLLLVLDSINNSLTVSKEVRLQHTETQRKLFCSLTVGLGIYHELELLREKARGLQHLRKQRGCLASVALRVELRWRESLRTHGWGLPLLVVRLD